MRYVSVTRNINNTMAGKRLNQLMKSGVIKPEDVVSFSFKGNKFSATFAEGGILHNCNWTSNKDITKRIFPGRTFTTLSDFTESCIQEILNEYSTRYSSWKRVLHVQSDRSLDEIWKSHMENKLKDVKKPTLQQLRQLNERLLERLAKANEKIDSLSSASATAHPIVLDSPHGTYMVIQRMIQNGDEDIIKNMKISEFREHLKYFSKNKVVVENPSMDTKWFDNLKQTEKESIGIARFVYDFFTKKKKRKAIEL